MVSGQVPGKHQPKGFKILHEDQDLIIGNKAPGVLTVGAQFDRVNTVHNALNQYIRKGNPRSTKCVYVVHRLDQATTGVLIFAKSETVRDYLKDNWKSVNKTYYAIVHGRLDREHGTLTSYLSEDDDYVVHSSASPASGKLAVTEYRVLALNDKYSLVKINLVTGRKNQIRVHFAEIGHPVVGDGKYGMAATSAPEARKAHGSKTANRTTTAILPSRNASRSNRTQNLLLHSYSIEFSHPFSKKKLLIRAPVPEYFGRFIAFDY